MDRTSAQVAAQVAVEAVLNSFEDFDAYTRLAVFANGLDQGVAPLYLDMLGELIREAVAL